MNKLQDWLGRGPARCALLLYLSVGLVQFLILPAGIEAWFGIHWMAALLGAAVLTWVPVMGQMLGLATAVDVLEWPVPLAVAVFLWPIWIAAIACALRRPGRSGGVRSDGGFQRRLKSFGEAKSPAADVPHSGTVRPL